MEKTRVQDAGTDFSPPRDGSGKFTPHITMKHAFTLDRRAEGEHPRLTAAVEEWVEGFIITDHNGVIVEVNPALERITGYGREELLGQSPSIFKSDQVDETTRRGMREAIQWGNVWNGHLVNKRKDGGQVEIDLTIFPIRNGNGELAGFIGIMRDVTYQHELEERLRRSQKLEAVGLLAGGIAHDFNNIITPIMGYLEIALSKLSPENEVVQDLNRVSKAALRARDLVSKIQIFSRTSSAVRQAMIPENLVNEVLDLLRSSLPANIRIHSDLETAGVTLHADSTQLHTMIMNLCLNAAQAMPDGGLLEVNLEYAELKEYEITPGQNVTGPYIRLSVSDSGQGMDKATQQRIFESFLTTKEGRKGTGLGLSTAYGVIEQHGGFIKVCSEVGEGSTFHVYLLIEQING